MIELKIIPNKSNLKSKKILFEDYFLNKLTNIIIEYSHPLEIHKFVHDLFYLKSIEEYDYALTRNLIGYENNYEIFIEIFNLFREYKPYEKYNLGLIRGSFLELLTYKYLKQIYEENKIHKESKIKIKNYESHTWDLIIDLKEYLKLYECKFSSEFIKRSHIDKMNGLKNKIDTSEIFLITFELKEIVLDDISNLKKDTDEKKYEEILSSIDFVYLEDYINENPLLSN